MSEQTSGVAGNLHRRQFLKGVAAAAGLGLSAGVLAACGDNTATSTAASAGSASTVAATTASTTTSAATSSMTTAAPTTNSATTPAATTTAATISSATTAATNTTASSATTAVAGTTAASGGSAPAGYTAVGKVASANSAPVAFAVGNTKGFVYFKTANQPSVYSNVCTHQGCAVAYDSSAKKLQCPCHGSQFDLTGQVLKGPAQLALQAYDAQVVGDTVYAKL